MILHFPFSSWEESRGFLRAEQEFWLGRRGWRAECRVEKLLLGAVSCRCNAGRRQHTEGCCGIPAAKEKPCCCTGSPKAPLLLAGLSRGAAGRFWGERRARGEKLCGFAVLVWSK